MTSGELCPSCSGERLYNLTFKHDGACPLLLPEDSTQAADHDRLLGNRSSFVREATDTERTLAAWIGMPDIDRVTIDNPLTVKVDWVGTRRRLLRVGGRPWFDPDADTSP
ncbi:MAG: hypothetical protein QOF30_714 [Acidimicrobiaceae bacterium]|nr:hypothetical protein [Acidimicrobiaceae bacterium]